MATVRFNPETFARCDACIMIGVSLAALTGYTFYRAIFDPSLLCHLCLLMALPPLIVSLLWSLWLLAWHVPHWRTTSAGRRWSIFCSALASFAFAAFFFMQ